MISHSSGGMVVETRSPTNILSASQYESQAINMRGERDMTHVDISIMVCMTHTISHMSVNIFKVWRIINSYQLYWKLGYTVL